MDILTFSFLLLFFIATFIIGFFIGSFLIMKFLLSMAKERLNNVDFDIFSNYLEKINGKKGK